MARCNLPRLVIGLGLSKPPSRRSRRCRTSRSSRRRRPPPRRPRPCAKQAGFTRSAAARSGRCPARRRRPGTSRTRTRFTARPRALVLTARATQSAQTPVNPTQLIPTNLEGFASAATNLTPEVLQENQPRNINEALTRVPGVIVINDDVGRSPRRYRRARLARPPFAQGARHGRRARQQPGALARSLGPLLGPDGPLRKRRGYSRHRHHSRPEQQLRRRQRAQHLAVRTQ